MIVALAVSAVPLELGCGPAVAPSSGILQPLEERRAGAIIERTIQASGVAPRPGRTFELEHGYQLREDTLIGAGPYGVVYLSEHEAKLAGAALPKRDAENTQLRLLRPDAEAIVLLLYQDAYRYDVGGENAATIVAAEKRLERDVADFLVHVVKMGVRR